MPVGRFRDDPRELDARERAVYARQYPEGFHVVGSLLGLAVPVAVGHVAPGAPSLLTSPLVAIVGLVVGGVTGYLLGFRYRERQLRRASVDERSRDQADETGSADATSTAATGPKRGE